VAIVPWFFTNGSAAEGLSIALGGAAALVVGGLVLVPPAAPEAGVKISVLPLAFPEGGGAAVFGSVQPQPIAHQPDGTLALADTQLQFQAGVQLLRSEFKRLQMAIQEGK